MISAKTSNDLFNKVRSKFANIQLGDSMGGVTANPGDAVFFDFEFSENSDEFGRVSISLADGETMKVFYNKGLVEKLEDENKTNWYSFLKELKDFAVEHQIGFDVRDITKPNLSQQDFKNLADTNKTVNIDSMSEELNRITKLAGVEKATATVAESLTGTKKSSYENLDKTRLIVRHSKPVESEMPGARTRHINSLYIENADGERFKYPVVHLAGARAMQRHVANGGLPHDEFGEHIIKMSEQIAQLNSFSRYVTTKDQLNDSAGDIIEKAKMKLETMRKYVKGLSKQKNYESVKASFQPSTIAEIDDETKNTLKDKFTLKHFDERVDQVLPLINSIMSEYDDEKPLSKKDVEIPAPVDGGDETLKFLNSGQPLVLKKNPSADMLTFRSEFKQKKDMLRTVLMDIATRILPTTPETDTIANFASAMANDLAKVGDAFGDVSSNTFNRDLKIAEKLGIRYVQDIAKMRKDPNYADTVRKDPQDVKAKVDRQGKAKVNVEDTVIEGWADNITEQKPYVSMYKGDDNKMVYDVLDKEGESAFKSDDYKIATDYLKKNFDQLSGKETDDDVNTAMTQTAMDDVNENPETDYEGSFDYELYGDDGETAYGKIHYKAVNGKVDPNSLQGEYEYEGNARVDDDLATQMIQPGGDEHDEALKAAQDDYDYEAKNKKESQVNIDDEYRFRDWLKKTHNKQVHELKPQEYAIISKQYRDEKNKTEEQPVEEDASDDALAQELAKYFHGIADGYPKDQHGDQEHEEMTSIADAFKTDGLQAGMNDINTSRFEFSSNPFDQDGSGDMDDDMMMLLKKHGVSAKMKGALAYLVKGSKAITNPEEETATEGNDFAQAVNKAKAAGMKPGDKFEVGGKEYTLKDAIEQAGLQLETFFGEEEAEVETDTKQPAELDHIKKLAGI